MRYIFSLLITGLISSCSWFSTPNDSEIPTIPAPPQKIAESNAAMPVITTPNKTSASAAKKSAASAPTVEDQERIREDRENGVVDQIKVNNKNLPSYYIYPTQKQNYDFNRIPDQNVSVPNWQISW